MFGEQLLVPTRCSGALWVPTLKVEGRSWKLVAVRRWSAAQKWPCRAEAMVFLIARTFARDCARAWSGWASVWVLAVCILQETGRSLPSRCSCLETSHRQSRRRAQSARCGLRASGSARRDCGRGTRALRRGYRQAGSPRCGFVAPCLQLLSKTGSGRGACMRAVSRSVQVVHPRGSSRYRRARRAQQSDVWQTINAGYRATAT